MADETIQTEQAVEETAVDTVEAVVEEPIDYSSQQIEIVVPQRIFIDDTEGKTLGEFEKIVGIETVGEAGEIIVTRKIVPMSNDEAIEKRITELKFKVAIGTATTTDKADLKLLIG